MPANKNAMTRYKILDKLLSSGIISTSSFGFIFY